MPLSTILPQLSNEQLVKLAGKFVRMCEQRMVRLASAEDNPYGWGGALSFGWDWATFGVYYPTMRARWSEIVSEGKGRGLTRVKWVEAALSKGSVRKRAKGKRS